MPSKLSARIMSVLRLRAAICAVFLLLAPCAALAAVVTTNEAGLDLIYSQASFGSDTVDIRFNAAQTLIAPNLVSIDSQSEFQSLIAAAPSASPTVNIFFVDAINWCGSTNPAFIGCGEKPGNIIAVESSFAANATTGDNLLGHELGHNLNLDHVSGTNTNLMNPTLSNNGVLTSSQVSTILASGLIQFDGAQRFVLITPIAVAVPEPQTWALMLGGLGFVVGVARRRNRSRA